MIATINNAIAKKDNEKGFTLIELLVVILIIGVLAAIAIPAFLNQREGAWKAQVQSDIANAIIAAESYAVDHNGGYTGLDDAALVSNGYNKTENVTVAVTGVTGTEYVLTGTHSLVPSTTFKMVYTHSTGKTVTTD